MADTFDEVGFALALATIALIGGGTWLGLEGHENLATGAISGALGLLSGRISRGRL